MQKVLPTKDTFLSNCIIIAQSKNADNFRMKP